VYIYTFHWKTKFNFFFGIQRKISVPNRTFNAEFKYVSSFSPITHGFFCDSQVKCEKRVKKMCIFTYFTGQQNLTFFLAHGGNYIIGFGRVIQCVQTVAVRLQKVLEVISTSVDTGLNPFNFVHKHFLQICVRKVTVQL
jgi:hypothetical protein